MKPSSILWAQFALFTAVSAAAQEANPAALAASSAATTARPDGREYLKFAEVVDRILESEVLAKWFPGALDKNGGGFWQNYREDWSRGAGGVKGIVYQSRLTWTATQAAVRFPEQSALYTAHARHGLDFLAGKMWDQKHGGFYWLVDDSGTPSRGRDADDGGGKQAYGNAFGIYAAAAVFKLTHDPAALDLAQKTFTWYDKHGHDDAHGGYFEMLTVDGQPNPTATPAVGGGPSSKSMNSSIHMLEALAGLYEVWPDPTVKSRLQEMFELVQDKIYCEPGYLIQFFTVDWQPKENEDSYGHDIETAYLLVDAASALGIPDDRQAWAHAKKLVDHALTVGWDQTNGGFYNSGGISGGRYASSREWWVEAEGLNVLLLLHERYGKSDLRYWNAFRAQWNWINQYGLDRVHGGFWPRVNNDGTPVHGAKSDMWTECYHQGRSLLNVSKRLRNLANDSQVQ